MTVALSSLKGYVPPKGFRITKIQRLEDGTFEVTLEPPRRG